MYNWFMNIKCANCNQRTIPFRSIFFNRYTECSGCKTKLMSKNSKVYRLTLFPFILFMIFMTIKIEYKEINNILGYLIITFVFIIILNLTTITEINKDQTSIVPKQQNLQIGFKIGLIASIFTYYYLHYELNIPADNPYILGLLLFIFSGLTFWIYALKKNQKK